MRWVPSSLVYPPRVPNSRIFPSAYSKIVEWRFGVSCDDSSPK